MNELSLYGAKIVNTNGLPALEARWFIDVKDTNGFEMRILGCTYDSIAQLISMMLGQPPPAKASDPLPSGQIRPGVAYSANAVGAGVLIVDMGNYVSLNCLKGMTNWMGFGGNQVDKEMHSTRQP